jgi:ABC-type uncharacterized transport system substrate-binding protein
MEKEEIFEERPDATYDKSFYSDMKQAKTDRGFFGHAKVNKQSIVKNPPPQPSQLGKDGFYTNVQNCEGKL